MNIILKYNKEVLYLIYGGRGESHWINKLSYNNDLTAHGGLPPWQIYIKPPNYKPVGIKNLMSFPRTGQCLRKNVKSATDSCPIYVLFRHNFVYLGPIV